MIKIYDLSHKLNNLTPVYQGNEPPEFTQIADFKSHGYRETQFRFHSHLGTHIDAPAHMIETGKTLDQLPAEQFWGNAFIIKTPINKNIDLDILKKFETEISKSDFVLFQTGWSQYWGTLEYFGRFPVLTDEAVQFLLQFTLKGIGFDTISADPMDSQDFPNHLAILGNNMIIIENLVFPGGFSETSGEFSCFPLPYENADGSPVRAVLKYKRA
jgi:kynurenine formamidase